MPTLTPVDYDPFARLKSRRRVDRLRPSARVAGDLEAAAEKYWETIDPDGKISFIRDYRSNHASLTTTLSGDK